MLTENRVLSFDANAEFYRKRAGRAIDQQDYTGALKHLRKAIRLEPDNLEYRMDLANVYALMGQFERSNLELQLIFHYRDLPHEALFGMGSNFMSMGDYDQAEAMMQVYCKMANEGDLVDQAHSALAYMAECDYETELDRELDTLSMDGKAALDAGDMDHAIDCLTRALEKDPDMLYVRNNLAMAYYCIGDMDKAWQHLDMVLKANPQDVHGRCNESLFCLADGEPEDAQEALQHLKLDRIEEIDELFKYCLALADVAMDEALLPALKKILAQTPYDISMLYLCGACQYNLGRYAESLLSFEKLNLTDPDSLLGETGLKYAKAALHGDTDAPARISYSYDLPFEVQNAITHCLEELTVLTPEEVAQRLDDEATRRYVHAAVMAGTEQQMQQGMLLLGYSACPQGERMLREILLSPTHSSYFKQMVMEAMRAMHAPEPYYCLQDGKLTLVRSKKFDFGAEVPIAYLSIMREAINHMAAIFNEEKAVEFAAGSWATYLMSLGGKYPKITQPFAWVKTIEGMYLEACGADVDWEKLALDAGVTPRTLSVRKKKLMQAGNELMIEHNT